MGLGSALGNIGRRFMPQVATTSIRTPSFLPEDEYNQPYDDGSGESDNSQQGPPQAVRPPISAASQMGGNAPPPALIPRGPLPTPPPPEPDFNSPEGGASLPAPAGVRRAPAPPVAPSQPPPQAMPQPPAPPNTPGGQKIGIGRQIGGALIQGAGMLFPPAMGAAHTIGQRVAQGSYPTQERAYEQQMAAQKAQTDLQKEQATTEETKQRGGFYKQQSETMAAEGKQKPILMKDGSIYDPRTNTVTASQKTMQEKATEYKSLGFSDEEARILAVGGKPADLVSKPEKTLEQHATSIVTNDALTPEQKQAKLEEIRNAHNILHPESPVVHFESDDKGNVTAVAIKPSQVQAAPGGQQPLGKIGKPSPPQQPGISLTPDAVQFWGQAAAQGIPLPSMGMGASGAQARQQIINAAPGAAQGKTLAENKTSLHADTASMASMQRMRDAVVAFEGTANANLDLFMKQAKSVVDSGSPMVNTPLRKINRNVLGGQELAAYDAARQVALTEIAKVVNNPNLTSQLSDNARKEVMGVVPENATLGQIVKVVGILRQDMANRKKYLDQGLGEIKARVGGGRGGQQQPAQPTQGTIRVRRKADGQTGSLNAADFDPSKYEKVQ